MVKHQSVTTFDFIVDTNHFRRILTHLTENAATMPITTYQKKPSLLTTPGF